MGRPRASLDVGAFRYRATWQRRQVVNQPGQDAETWTDLGAFWAFVTPVYATESMASNQQQAIIQQNLHIRGNVPVLATDRFLFDMGGDMPQRVLNVTGTVGDDRDQGFMTLACMESAD